MAWWRQDGVRAVLISERNQENEMVNRMTHRGIGVTKLMSQVRTLAAARPVGRMRAPKLRRLAVNVSSWLVSRVLMLCSLFSVEPIAAR